MENKNSDWLKLADYGDHPHSRGLQRLTHADAIAIERNHRSLYGRLKRAVGGIPVYVGHPDEPTLHGDPAHADTKAYGWIHDVAAKADGLWVRPKWSAAGKAILEGAHYKFFSPRWKLTKHKDGSLRPFEIVSVGLTNNPNIDAYAITGDATDENKTKAETAANGKLWGKKEEGKKAEGEKKNETSPASAVDARLAAVAAAVGLPVETPIKELVAAVTSFAQERMAHIEKILDLAVERGRMTPEARNEWKKKLLEDFPTAANCLEQKMEEKPEPFLSDTLCNCKGAPDFLTLVKNRQAASGESFADAWNALKATHRATFEKLKNL